MGYKEKKMILIANIRRIIKEKGLKQCAIAKKAGFSPRLFRSMLNERKVILAEYIPSITDEDIIEEKNCKVVCVPVVDTVGVK